MFKKFLLIVVLVLATIGLVYADGTVKVTPRIAEFTFSCVTDDAACTDANGNTSSSVGYMNEGTCNLDAVNGTVAFDIHGSVDGTNWSDLVGDRTAAGSFSFVNMPFTHIRAYTEDDNDDASTTTIQCSLGRN